MNYKQKTGSIIFLLKTLRRIIILLLKHTFVFFQCLDCIALSLLKGKRFRTVPQKEKKVLLLGNGPSVNDLDLKLLSQKFEIACVNWFATKGNSMFLAIKPRYYFLIDPNFFKIGLEKRPKEYVPTLDGRLEEIKNIFNAITWNMELIIPQGCLFAVNNKNITVKNITRQSLYGDYLKYLLYFLYNHNLANCGMQNVICGALYYFIANRFGEIYISGVDANDFKLMYIDERNHLLYNRQHFYGEATDDLTESGAFPLGCFYINIANDARMFKEFHYLRQYADFRGVKVINLSLKSYIDSFEKMDWKKCLLE